MYLRAVRPARGHQDRSAGGVPTVGKRDKWQTLPLSFAASEKRAFGKVTVTFVDAAPLFSQSRSDLPAGVICQPELSRRTNPRPNMSRRGARAANRRKRLVQSEPLVFRMHKSEFSAAIVARPSGWLISTFRMAICRDTPNSTRQRETMSNVVLPGGAVYVPQGEAHKKRPTAQCPSISAVTCRPTE